MPGFLRRSARPVPRGQTLVLVALVMMVMAMLLPVLVYMTKQESHHADKHKKTSLAYNLAVAGTQKAYRALTISTTTWNLLMVSRVPPTNMSGDHEFNDVAGGSYVIVVSSGPNNRQATVTSIGRDRLQREVRMIIALYTEQVMTGTALYNGGGANVSGNNLKIEWGSVVSKGPIVTNKVYPQFFSASSVSLDGNGGSPPNCDSPDCCQWFSYHKDIPPFPDIDLDFYRSSAAAGGTYFTGDKCWKNSGGGCGANGGTGACCNYLYADGGTVFVDGNLTIASPGTSVIGNLIVTGNLTFATGNFGKGAPIPTLPVPREAWKNYCRNWAQYQTFDGSAPSSFPGLDNSYSSSASLTYTPTSDKMFLRGFLFVGGNMSLSGGGGSAYISGSGFVQNTSTMTASSNVTFYFDESVAREVKTTTVPLVLEKWYDRPGTWPSGALTQVGSHSGGEE